MTPEPTTDILTHGSDRPRRLSRRGLAAVIVARAGGGRGPGGRAVAAGAGAAVPPDRPARGVRGDGALGRAERRRGHRSPPRRRGRPGRSRRTPASRCSRRACSTGLRPGRWTAWARSGRSARPGSRCSPTGSPAPRPPPGIRPVGRGLRRLPGHPGRGDRRLAAAGELAGLRRDRVQLACVLDAGDGSKLAVHVLALSNTVSWQYRYVPVPGPYDSQTAQNVMDSLADQMQRLCNSYVVEAVTV